MKPHAIRHGAPAAALVGRVLCHDVRDGARKIVGRKGDTIDEPLATALGQLAWTELHVLELEPGDVHEERAGKRLAAAAAAGDGVEVKGYAEGKWTIAATRRGLFAVQTGALSRVNALEGICLYTLYDGLPVEPGEVVARAKVTPLAIPEATLETIEQVGREAGGLLSVKAFSVATVGAVARESLDERQRARFEKSLQTKIDWFGARLLPVRYAGAGVADVVAELEALRSAGAAVIVVAGASALDPLDPVFGALDRVGARMERHGVPAHPGSLLWVATWDGRPVIGMPSCGMFSEATTFDLILPRILAGERIGSPELAALGHGGLLSRESAYRFPPYRANVTRGELE
jgi:hypothetical protein